MACCHSDNDWQVVCLCLLAGDVYMVSGAVSNHSQGFYDSDSRNFGKNRQHHRSSLQGFGNDFVTKFYVFYVL